MQIAFSSDSGRHFGAPLVVDADAPTGRVDAVLLNDGSALVSWIGSDAGDTALRVRHIQPDGTAGSPIPLAAVSRSRSTGMPRMVHSDGHIYVAWVAEQNGTPQVQMTHVAVDTLQ
mgnify:CR=1 FL=1